MSFKEKTSVYKIIILYYARKWSIYRSFIENTSVPLEEKPLLNAPKFLFTFKSPWHLQVRNRYFSLAYFM